ncbi:MAG: flagellar export protein FliJ [Gammaproteobacteria bacterium]
MTRSKRMQRIVALADAARKQASQQLAQSHRLQEESRQRLAQFKSYQQEYAKAIGQGQGTLTAASLREARRFIEQIERTIAALETQSRQAAQRCEEDVQRWQREARRVEALSGVLDGARRSEGRDAAGREQREQDDRPRLGHGAE